MARSGLSNHLNRNHDNGICGGQQTCLDKKTICKSHYGGILSSCLYGKVGVEEEAESNVEKDEAIVARVDVS